MKQIYYAIQSTLHGRGSNVTKIISLSLGLTIGVLLFSQIAFELNYEKCYPEADRLVLVRGGGENVKTGEKGEGYDDSLFAPMAEAFRSDLSQWIENATVIFNFETLNVFKDGHKLKDVNYAYVDTCYFRTFGIKVLKGNPEELQRAGSIFVSETFVRDVFGGQDPVGQKLSLDKQHELTVRGVYQDTPENTAYHFDFVAPIYAGGGYIGGGTWGRNDIYYTILRLRDGVDREEINRQIYKAMQNIILILLMMNGEIFMMHSHCPKFIWMTQIPALAFTFMVFGLCHIFCGNHELCISSYCYHEPQGKKYRCA